MAEQLANLYSSTLAAPYVAGSGSITVNSAAGAPTSGTFSVTILDAGTLAVILIFRVTSVAGAVFSGASEGPDANAASGSGVVGTMLTVAAINQLFADHAGGGGFIQPLTPPVAGGLTPINFNVGSGVSTVQTNLSSPVTAISLVQNDPSNSQNIVALAKNKINALYTLTIGCTLQATAASILGGLWISDGGSPPQSIFMSYMSNVGLRLPSFSDFTTFAGDVYTAVLDPMPLGPMVWFRVQETSTQRIYSVSADGSTWMVLIKEPVATRFATAQYGFACACRAGGSMGVTCYSMVETTP
jgi:hypothetical protein